MAYSFSKAIQINVKKEDLQQIIISTFSDLRWKYKKINDNYYEASIGMGFSTYGENIFLTVKSNNSLFIESKLKIFQLVDWGKNEKNVVAFEDSLQTIIRNNYGDNVQQFSEIKNGISMNKQFFLEKISKYHRLFDAQMLTEEEFSKNKSELIKKLEDSKQVINTEDLLISLISFKQKNILSKNEIELIKKIIG